MYVPNDDREVRQSAYAQMLAELKAAEYRVYKLDSWEEPRDGMFCVENGI